MLFQQSFQTMGIMRELRRIDSNESTTLNAENHEQRNLFGTDTFSVRGREAGGIFLGVMRKQIFLGRGLQKVKKKGGGGGGHVKKKNGVKH